MKILVLHTAYGCDTGCCGHVVEVDGREVGGFQCDHPDGTAPEAVKRFVEELVTKACGAEHVQDVDWDNCVVLDD